MDKLNSLCLRYKAFIASHPKIAGGVVVAEAAVVSAVSSMFEDDFDFAHGWPKRAAVFVATSVALSLRNYLKETVRQQPKIDSQP